MEKKKPPTEDQYRTAVVQVALDYCPPIKPCKDCKWPVINGYCCHYCGSVDP